MIGGEESNWVAEVTKLVDQNNAKVVLDLAGVTYVSSAGLGDLVRVTDGGTKVRVWIDEKD